MQDLLNILQQIKDKAEPTLTQSIYERHPVMLITDIVFGIVVVVYIVVAIANILSQSDDFPTETVILMTLVMIIQVYVHRIYQHEMTEESEQRVNDVLKATPAVEYAELVKQVKLADLDQIEDTTLRAIAKHVKDIETPGLFK